MSNWYVNDRGVPAGPFPTSQIIDALQHGQLSSETQVCPVGGTVWCPVIQVPDFSVAMSHVAPASPHTHVGAGGTAPPKRSRSLALILVPLSVLALLGLGVLFATGATKGLFEVEPKETQASSQVPVHLKAACDKNQPNACVVLGLFQQQGVLGTAKDEASAQTLIAKGLSLLEQACTADDEHACSSLRSFYSQGHVVPKDERRAETFSKPPPKTACTSGPSGACYLLAEAAIKTDKKHAKELFEKAATLLKKDCADGQPSACLHLAKYFNNEEYSGKKNSEQSQKFWDQATALYERQCNDSEVRSCSVGADVLFVGSNPGERDRTRSRQLNIRGCDLGDADCCASVGVHYAQANAVDRDDARAVATLKQSCGGGSALGCSFLAQLYGLGRGGLKEDKDTERQLQTVACHAGAIIACLHL